MSPSAGFGRAVMRCADYGLPALGYVSAYTEVQHALAVMTPAVAGTLKDWKADDAGVDVRVIEGEKERRLRTRLLVLADGGANLARKPADEKISAYDQHAITAEVRAGRSHGGIAWERFTAEGPLALLPFRNHHALVWGMRPASAKNLMDLPDAEFLARLRQMFGGRLGDFLSAGPRTVFPLVSRRAELLSAPRTVAVGNAAQTLHPVAGQGLNLGLRDAWELAQSLIETPREEIGSEASLSRYARGRRMDRRAGIAFTDFLARFFSDSVAPAAVLRGAGLAALDLLPPARRFLARRMIFGARALP